MSYCKKRVEENLQPRDNKTEYGTNKHTSFRVLRKCSKCKHTYNLTIYERRKPGRISPKEYERFLANDEELALQYGTDKGFFGRNKAEIIR